MFCVRVCLFVFAFGFVFGFVCVFVLCCVCFFVCFFSVRIGGVSMPEVSGDFLAMSVFFYAMHCLHELGPAELVAWPEPTLAEVRRAAEGFCAMEWEVLLEDHSVSLFPTHSAQGPFFRYTCVYVDVFVVCPESNFVCHICVGLCV